MSYTELIPFINGTPQPGIEFRNSWGGAARIWDALFKCYIPKRHEYDSWICDPNDKRLWDLAKREDLLPFERAVHAFTFDLFYVRREHIRRLANDLRLFAEKYPAGERVDHLPAWAKWMDDHAEAEAIGLRATSVSENLWFCYSPDTDETKPVPLSEGTEVYDWLEKMTA